MQLEKLFIKDSKGKVREWSVKTVGNKMVVSHGLVGGKIQERVTTCKGKNLGKANETTPEQQAELEAKAKWKYQIEREDYHVDVNMAGNQVRPMLALDYHKVSHRVNWEEAVAQPKLDGLRLIAGYRYRDKRTEEIETMTRKGESYYIPHIDKDCKILLEKINAICDNKCLGLDGELYNHGLSLQTITSYARKYQKSKTESLGFYLFDLVIPSMSFEKRYSLLEEVKHSFPEMFHLVENRKISKESLEEVHAEYVSNGYEGAMVRHSKSNYDIGQRSAHLFKYKEFYDDEVKIVELEKDKDGNAVLICLMEKGQKLSCLDYEVKEDTTFKCTPKRTHDERKQMLLDKDKLIGKYIKFKYQALTDDGKPQFPVGLELRECDENGKPLI